MEYVIAAAASAWFVAFLLVEDRVGGKAGYLWRLLGTAPLVVMVVIAWTGRFSYDALMIVVVTVVVSTTVDSVGRWSTRRAEAKRQAG